MDKNIIEEAKSGELKAFRSIFEYYAPKMRPVALLYVHTVFEADDVIQEAFLKVYQQLKMFKHEGSFEGWVRRIVVNTALNLRKSQRSFYELREKLDDASENDLGVEVMEYPEDVESSVLLKIIQEMPDGYKLVFTLYVFEEFSHKEISEKLGISEGTSRTQYAKAKKYIIKQLDRLRNGA